MKLASFIDFSLAYSAEDPPALKHVSLEINQGETIILSGLSGAGKTTLCLAAADCLATYPAAVTSGRIDRQGGRPGTGGIGMVMQNFYAQISYLRSTVFEEVAFPCENSGIPREEIVNRVKDALKMIRIEQLADRNPLELSGGEKQKVVLASAIAMQPALLVLDEPISQLDPESAFHLAELLKSLKSETTLLIAENDPYLTLALADRVVVLSEGEVIADGPLQDILGTGIEDHIELPAWTECVSLATKRGLINGVKGARGYELNYRSALRLLGEVR